MSTTIEPTLATRRVEELQHLRELHGAVLTPQAVVEFARDPSTACHSWFVWDDDEAAEKYRIWQARRLLKVVVMPVAGREPVPINVHLRSDADGGYRHIVAVLQDADHRAELLAQAKQELRRVERQYNTLSELASVWDAIRAAVQ